MSSVCAGLSRYFLYQKHKKVGHQVANMSQLSMSHQLLPKEEWTKPEEVQLPLRMHLPKANR